MLKLPSVCVGGFLIWNTTKNTRDTSFNQHMWPKCFTFLAILDPNYFWYDLNTSYGQHLFIIYYIWLKNWFNQLMLTLVIILFSSKAVFINNIFTQEYRFLFFLLKYPEIQPIRYQHNEQLGLAYQPTRYSLSPGNCSICCNMMHTLFT